MTVLAWFLSEAAIPVSMGAVSVLVIDVARRAPARGRHYRWRNWWFLRHKVPLIELRSRVGVRGGSGEEAGSAVPRPLPVTAGVERRAPQRATAPPAPSALAGAPCPRPDAPARPQPARRGGGLP